MKIRRHGSLLFCGLLASLLGATAAGQDAFDVDQSGLSPAVIEPAPPAATIPQPEPAPAPPVVEAPAPAYVPAPETTQQTPTTDTALQPKPAETAPPVEAAQPSPETLAPAAPTPETHVAIENDNEPGTPATAQELDPEVVLQSPTQYMEAYEKVRRDRFRRGSRPDWSFNILFNYHAFAKADLRVSNAPTPPTSGTPYLNGIGFGFERMLLHLPGILAVGSDFALYYSSSKGAFSGLRPGMYSAAPYVQYQAHFFSGQWIVPTARYGEEFLRYSYRYTGNSVKGVKPLSRLDLGLMLYLNALEPASAGELQSSWGIKRTYLAAYYSIATDFKKKDFDASERTYRLGLRFEY